MNVAFSITLPSQDMQLIDGIMAAKHLKRSQAIHYLLMVAVKSLKAKQDHQKRFVEESTYAANVKPGGVIKPEIVKPGDKK